MDTAVLLSYVKVAWQQDLKSYNYVSLLKEGRTTHEVIDQRVQQLCRKLATNLNLNNMSELYEVHAYHETHISQMGRKFRYTAFVKVLERIGRRVTTIKIQEDGEPLSTNVRIEFRNLVINY